MLSAGLGTDFTYNIVEQLLVGRLDGVTLSAHVVSGGRAGSKAHGAVNPFLANNPYATHIKKTTHNPGGPLILGEYTMKTHESRNNWIRLIPSSGNYMRGRAGFAIHGRGQRGSDGCIVPTDFAVVQLLYKLVAAREKKGGPAPTLTVVAIGDLDFIEKRLDALTRTA
jgi:hypothetical protein